MLEPDKKCSRVLEDTRTVMPETAPGLFLSVFADPKESFKYDVANLNTF